MRHVFNGDKLEELSVKMPQVQTLRDFVQQRLTVAAEEIFELFERTVAEYEETLCQQRKLLDAAFKPQVRLKRADVQLLSVNHKEVHPEEQDWRPSLDQDDPQKLPYIKEEQEELLTSQEQDQLQGLEEVDICKVTFTAVPVKSEEDYEDRHLSSQLHYAEEMKTDADGEDCGGPKPDKNLNQNSLLQAVTDDEASHFSQHEKDHNFDWEETNGTQSGSNPLRNNEEPEINTGKTPVLSFECAPRFSLKKHLQEPSGIQTREKPFSCSVCGKKYMYKSSVTAHMRLHSEEQRFSCSFCHKSFPYRSNLLIHMRIHTWEKPFSCPVCNAKFTQRSNMVTHLKIHQKEKPNICSICGTTFTKKEHLTKHMKIHTEETQFICFLCGKRFSQFLALSQHRCVGVSIEGKSS